MRKPIMLSLVAALLPTLAATADVISDRIESVGLFKNGLAYVTREIEVARSGESVLTDVPKPAHGTFWVESPEGFLVDIQVTERDLPRVPSVARLARALNGAKITAHFTKEDLPSVSGTIELIDDGDQAGPAFGQDYEAATQRYGWYGSSSLHRHSVQSGVPGSNAGAPFRYLTVKSEKGTTILEPALVSHAVIEAKDGSSAVLAGSTLAAVMKTPRPNRQPAMIFNVKSLAKKTAQQQAQQTIKLRVSYLTKGIAWAPSYRIDLVGEKQLQLTQKSVIKNELGDIQDAEFFLITGFPSLDFSGVISPLSVETTWMSFFQQLSAAANPGSSSPHVMTQQAVMHNSIAPQPSLPTLPTSTHGEGADLFYHSIGRRTLALGDSLTVTLPPAETDYQRIVEWVVPDNRDHRGRFNHNYNEENSEKWHGVAWDSIQLKNPLDRPMTTGPAMVVAGGKVLGQQTSYFVSPGEGTVQHITKALSIRTMTSEQEEPGSRETVYIAGNDYQRTNVKGSLTARNHRAEAIELVIRRRFSGELLEADEEPVCRLMAEGVYSVNQRNELIWTVQIEPGEEKVLTYRYSVLVDR